MTTTLDTHPLAGEPTPDAGNGSPDRPAAPIVPPASGRDVDWRLPVTGILVVGAAITFLIGWFGISGERDVFRQLPYFLSAGGIGLGLLVAALLLFIDYVHSWERGVLLYVLERLDDLEETIREERGVEPPASPPGGARRARASR